MRRMRGCAHVAQFSVLTMAKCDCKCECECVCECLRVCASVRICIYVCMYVCSSLCVCVSQSKPVFFAVTLN